MRLKYTIEKNNKANELILREYTAIDGERFTILNESTYNRKKIETAVSKGEKSLLSALRTDNLYPPSTFAVRLSQLVMELLHSRERNELEIVVDDSDHLDKKWKKRRRLAPIEEEPLEAEDVLGECTDETCTLNENGDKDSEVLQEVFPFDEVA